MKTRIKLLWSVSFVLLVAVLTMYARTARAEASDNFGSSNRTLVTRRSLQNVELPDKSMLFRKSVRPGSEQVSASLGFDLSIDAFSFANWGNEPGREVFDTASMVDLFGSYQVCRGSTPVGCELTDRAIDTKDRMEDALRGGYCEGMAVAAGLNYLSRVNGGTSVVAGTRREVAPTIAKWWATQLDSRVQEASAASRGWQPSAIAASIFESISDGRVVTMGVYFDGGAHTVLPISAAWMGEVLLVGVYDPNVPGQERFVAIDTVTESWTYETVVHRVGVFEKLAGQGIGGLDLVPLDIRSLPMSASLG